MVRFDVFCQMTTMRLRTGRWPIGPSMTKTAARAVKVLLTAGPTPGLTINTFFILFAFGKKVIDGLERPPSLSLVRTLFPFVLSHIGREPLKGFLMALNLALWSASGSKYVQRNKETARCAAQGICTVLSRCESPRTTALLKALTACKQDTF